VQRFVCFYDGILTKFACLAERLNGSEKPKKKKKPSPSDACQQSDAVAQGSL